MPPKAPDLASTRLADSLEETAKTLDAMAREQTEDRIRRARFEAELMAAIQQIRDGQHRAEAANGRFHAWWAATTPTGQIVFIGGAILVIASLLGISLAPATAALGALRGAP